MQIILIVENKSISIAIISHILQKTHRIVNDSIDKIPFNKLNHSY